MSQRKDCRLCAKIAVLVMCAGLGAGAGLGADALGASRELSMAATFFAAMAPLLWWARRSRNADS